MSQAEITRALAALPATRGELAERLLVLVFLHLAAAFAPLLARDFL